VSGEEQLLNAIKAGLDAHSYTANKAWGGKDNPRAIEAAIHALELDGSGPSVGAAARSVWDRYHLSNLEDLTPEIRAEIARDWLEKFDWDIEKAEASLKKQTCRARAKMLMFAKIYGGKTHAVMSLTGCSYQEALQFIKEYDDLYPGINKYIEELSYEARRNGYIINRFGRRLAINRDKAYVAVNYMVQGSAADLLKDRMIALNKYLKTLGLDIHIVMTVHDEIVLEINKKHAFKSVLKEIKDLLEDHTGHFNIDLPVEVSLCKKRWDNKIKLSI